MASDTDKRAVDEEETTRLPRARDDRERDRERDRDLDDRDDDRETRPYRRRRLVAGERSRRRRTTDRGGILRTLIVAVAAIVIALLVFTGLNSIFNFGPFGSRDIDRSGPAVLTAMRDLSEYHAASGEYQVVIDIEKDTKWVPGILKGKRTIFLAIGSVDAYIDFGKLGEDAVQVSPDRKSVTITLPKAQYSKPTVDPEESRVLDRDLGVVDRLGGLFSDNPNPQDQQMWITAQQRLGEAAKHVGLGERAEQNTKVTLEGLMRSLGFENVTIKFEDPKKPT